MAHPRIIGAMCLVSACGLGTKSGVLSEDSSGYEFEDVEIAMTEPVTESQLNALRGISVRQFYADLLKSTTDHTVQIGDQKFTGIRSALEAAEPYFNKLDQSYESWAAFAASKFDFKTAPSRQVTRDTFSNLGRNFANHTGSFAKLKKPPSIKTKINKAAEDPQLQLADGSTANKNLAALAAISLAMRHAGASGLALSANRESTNSMNETECKNVMDFSAVSRIDSPIPGTNRLNICSGTFYKGDKKFDYLVTAAHCTENPLSEHLIKHPNGTMVKGIVVRNAPKPGNDPKPVDAPTMESTDISIIAFPAGTARGYMRITEARANVGQKVTVAGFGSKTQNSTVPIDGSFGCGNNTVAENSEQQGVIKLFGERTAISPSAPRGEQSIAGKGDSGGPIIRINADGIPEVVGITSTGTQHGRLMPSSPGYSKHTDVTSKWSAPFIRGRSTLDISDFPVCTNGSDQGNGFGVQPGIGGIDNKTCRVPTPSGGPAKPDTQEVPSKPTQATVAGA